MYHRRDTCKPFTRKDQAAMLQSRESLDAEFVPSEYLVINVSPKSSVSGKGAKHSGTKHSIQLCNCIIWVCPRAFLWFLISFNGCNLFAYERQTNPGRIFGCRLGHAGRARTLPGCIFHGQLLLVYLEGTSFQGTRSYTRLSIFWTCRRVLLFLPVCFPDR